jgi:hypothetical protein
MLRMRLFTARARLRCFKCVYLLCVRDSGGLVCAGAIAFGLKDVAQCPPGSTFITNAEQCKGAAATAEKTWKGIVSDPTQPYGCFFNSYGVNFNTDTTLAEGRKIPSYLTLLCAGSHTHSHGRARRTHARTRALYLILLSI